MRRYLLVDDNLALAENLAEIIRDAGDDAVTAAHAAEAVTLARTGRFDCLITDMRMPVMSGAALIHAIRKVDPGLPAVVITAYTGEGDIETARHEGILSVFPKPTPLGPLLASLGRARRNGLVALVEDDPVLRDNLTEALQERGFTAVTAGSVVETDRLGEVQPFAALVDLRIPGGPDGEAMRRLAARFPGLPFVIVTAHAELTPPLEAEALFRKPFASSELLAVFDRLHAARPAP